MTPERLAARIIARVMIKATVSEREEVLKLMARHSLRGLEIIQGTAGAAETAYQLADDMVERVRA